LLKGASFFFTEPPLSGLGYIQSASKAHAAAREQLLFWLRASDYEAFGHTLRFRSLPEIGGGFRA
jgi:hypothetical protein